MIPNKDILSWLAFALDSIRIDLRAPYVFRDQFSGKHADEEYEKARAWYLAQHASVVGSEAQQQRVYEQVLRGFFETLPLAARQVDDNQTSFYTSLIELIADPMKCIEALTDPFFGPNTELLFHNIRTTLAENKKTARAGNPRETVYAYLKGTPFMIEKRSYLFEEKAIPLHLNKRNEHHWIVAPSGSGKSVAITHLVMTDIKKVVAEDKGCVVIMDSQSELIDQISRFKGFLDMADKFLMIDAADLIPINLFSMGKKRRTNEALVNHTLDLLLYCFNSLVETELTAKQTTFFNSIIRVCMEIPNATLDTFRDFLEDKHEQYAPYIAKAGKETQHWFETQYLDKGQYGSTKQEVSWRLKRLRDASVFDRMFSANPSDFDFFEELGKSQVIFIDTDKELLGDRTEIFGRMWIALLLQASQQRAAIAKADRAQVYFYIDEVGDYIETDEKIATILDQARKMNIGMILAHQRMSNIKSPNVRDALANCAIRMSRATDDSTVAHALRVPPPFIHDQPKGSFALYVREVTPHAVSVQFPLLHLDRHAMSDSEYQKLLASSRARFKVQPIESIERQEYEPTPEEDEPPPEPKVKKGRKLDPSF